MLLNEQSVPQCPQPALRERRQINVKIEFFSKAEIEKGKIRLFPRHALLFFRGEESIHACWLVLWHTSGG